MTRNNIIMMKLDVRKKVTLPNGRTCYTKNKRVRINSLPDNIRIRRTCPRKRRGEGRKRKRAQIGWI